MPIILPKINGLSDTKWSGVQYSVSKCVGLDLHGTPGIIKNAQAIVTSGYAYEYCKVMLTLSDGSILLFSAESGKIYRRTYSGTAGITLVYTTVPTTGNTACLGAEVYDGYIYWATSTKLHRILEADVLALGFGGVWTTAEANWATFTTPDNEYHPMQVQGTELYIGAGNYIDKVENLTSGTGTHTFVSNALDLTEGYRVKCLSTYDIDLVIGTTMGDDVYRCKIFRWDRVSGSWYNSDEVFENGINAFIKDDNYLYVQAGSNGNIYYYNGSMLENFKRIPGDYAPGSKMTINPNAVATLRTIPIFGVSNVLNNPCDQGVYSFGSYSKSYPKLLDLTYPLSNTKLNNIEIGAIAVSGVNMIFSWRDKNSGTVVGVSELDNTSKRGSSYFETMFLTNGEARNGLKTLKEIYANYALLPTGTTLNFYYKKNNDDTWHSMTGKKKDSLYRRLSVNKAVNNIANLQIKVEFIQNGNDCPLVESFGLDISSNGRNK